MFPLCPWVHPIGISPVVECIGFYVLNTCENSHIVSLALNVRYIMVGKVKWKALELTLPGKLLNQRQHCIPGGIPVISAIRALEDAEVLGLSI